MKALIPYFLQSAIATGVIADSWFGVAEAGNIAIAVVWIIIAISFVALFGDKDKIQNKDSSKLGKAIMRLLFSLTVLSMFAAGWFFTGTIYLLSWVALWIKKQDATTDNAEAA